MYYKINVYKLENIISKNALFSPKTKDERRRFKYLDNIIVEKTKTGEIKEIYTEFNIDLFSKDDIEQENFIKDKVINYKKLREMGVQIFAYKEDFIKDNFASLDDVDIYFKYFFDSDYKKLFDDLEAEKEKIKQKVIETKMEYLRLRRKKD